MKTDLVIVNILIILKFSSLLVSLQIAKKNIRRSGRRKIIRSLETSD